MLINYLFLILIYAHGLWSEKRFKSLEEELDNLDSSTCFTGGVEYHGGGLDNPMVADVRSPTDCQHLCQGRSGCNFFTWINNVHDVEFYRETCWLKGSQGSPQHCDTCVSGPRNCEGEATTTAPPSTQCCSFLTISSSGLTPDFQWTRLGSYVLLGTSPDGRPTYRQIEENTPNYLYYLEWLGVWYVNDDLLVNMGGLINWGDAWCPSDLAEDWSFYRWGDGFDDWDVDPTLKVQCGEKPAPTNPTTTTTTTTTRTTTTKNPNVDSCTWGSACTGCAVWADHEGTRYCCADHCDQGDVFVWEEEGHVVCQCHH